MEERHTIPNLKERIEAILLDWGIANKCVAIVHDNAANIVGAAKASSFFEYSVCCFAHSLQLALNKIFENEMCQNIIVKCSNIVSHFKHSNVATNALNNKQLQLGIKNNKLIQSVKTRWNSTCHMLERLLEQREAITSVLSDRSITPKGQIQNLVLCEQEWDRIENIVKLLKPFDLITNVLSSENQPSISMVMPLLKSLMENFVKKSDPEDESEILTKLCYILETELKQRFKSVFDSSSLTGLLNEVDLMDISSFLDPRFKNEERYFGSGVKTKRVLTDKLENIPDEENSKEGSSKEKTALDILFPNHVTNYLNNELTCTSPSKQYRLICVPLNGGSQINQDFQNDQNWLKNIYGCQQPQPQASELSLELGI